jgi:putative ABC transport system permease protein
LALGEGTQQIVVFLENENQSSYITSLAQNIFGNDIIATDWNDNYWVAVQKMNSWIYIIAYAVLLVVASFLIINTIIMVINERVKEIGMMGSLGMTRMEIVKVFFFEYLFLAGLGALCGVFLGGILIGILSNFPIRIGISSADMPMNNAVFFEFSFNRLLLAWVMGIIITSIATLIPSAKSAFIEPVEALRR